MNMIDSRNSGDNAQLSHPDMRFIDCEYSINPINSHNIMMSHLMGKTNNLHRRKQRRRSASR